MIRRLPPTFRRPAARWLPALLIFLGASVAASATGATDTVDAASSRVGAAADTASAAVPDSALAVFDGGIVFPHDFNDAWWLLSPPQRPPGDPVTSRKAFLHSVVDRMLLAEAARKRPLVLEPEESLKIEQARTQLIQNALFFRLTKDLKPPTDADVERYRRQKAELAEIRFVTFRTWEQARSWKSRLTFGTPFSELDAAIAREGAQLATADTFRLVAADQIPDTLADLIWSMRPGQVSDPQDYQNQPTIIMVRSFAPRPGRLPSGENYAIKADLQSRQYARVRERYRLQLAEQVGRTFEDANMRILLNAHLKLPPRSGVDSLTGTPVIRPNLALPYIPPSETLLVLARTNQPERRTVTIGDYLRFWAQVAPFARPEVREMLSLQGAVDRIALAPAILAEARQRNLEGDPEVQSVVDNMREGYSVDHFYRDMFESKVKVTEAALRKMWAADPAHYNDRASVSPRMIVVSRKSLADSLRSRLAAGASFTELVKQYSEDPATAPKEGLAGTVYQGTQQNTGLEEAMFATRVGKIGGPEKTPQGWVIWRIESATPGLKRTFAQARDMVERDFKILEADRMLTEYLDRVKKERHVRYFEDRITADLGRGGPWGD